LADKKAMMWPKKQAWGISRGGIQARQSRLVCGINARSQSAKGSEEPGIDMLAHGGESKAEEPAVTARGTSLEQVKVVLFAFDRAFGTGAGVGVKLPKVTLSRDASVQAVILLGIGVDDSTIGRARATVAKKWTSGNLWGFGGSGQGASPLDTQAVIAEASLFHSQARGTDGNAVLQS